MKKDNILILCTGNAARSQMAEGYFRKFAGDKLNIFSAGLEPKRLHPMSKRVMKEDGIDIENQKSKGVDAFLGKLNFRYLIIVCAKAEKNCPTTFPGALGRLFWPFEDPAAAPGSDEEKLEIFRAVRNQIKSRIQEFVEKELTPTQPHP